MNESPEEFLEEPNEISGGILGGNCEVLHGGVSGRIFERILGGIPQALDEFPMKFLGPSLKELLVKSLE